MSVIVKTMTGDMIVIDKECDKECKQCDTIENHIQKKLNLHHPDHYPLGRTVVNKYDENNYIVFVNPQTVFFENKTYGKNGYDQYTFRTLYEYKNYTVSFLKYNKKIRNEHSHYKITIFIKVHNEKENIPSYTKCTRDLWDYNHIFCHIVCKPSTFDQTVDSLFFEVDNHPFIRQDCPESTKLELKHLYENMSVKMC